MKYFILILVGLLTVVGSCVGFNHDWLTHTQYGWICFLGVLIGIFGVLGTIMEDW